MKAMLWLVFGVMSLVTTANAQVVGGPPFRSGQVWRGTYTCGQGQTSLTFRIQTVSARAADTELGKAHRVEAVFDFDFNNRSAAGAFYMSGKFYPDSGVATFDPGPWIRQPPGYSAVGMDGEVSADGTEFAGKVLLAGCRGFQLRLVSG